MKASGKKTKGKAYETKISEMIHESLLNIPEYKKLCEEFNDPKMIPHRNSSSGAEKDALGDIDLGLARKYLPLFIECKHWKTLDLSLNEIFKGCKILIDVYEKQARPKANKLIPVVVFKGNRTRDFVFTEAEHILVRHLYNGTNIVYIDKYAIMLFEDLLQSNLVQQSYVAKEL